MSEEIVFYHNPQSRSAIVRWMLEELELPYRVELLRFDQKEQKQPAYLAINPMGKVPSIVHRGVVVTEVAAICTYLADAFPARKLAPALDDPRRGTYLRWLFFAAACVEPAVSDRAFQRPAVDPSAIGYGSYEDVMRTVETALARGPFLLGEWFTAADVYLGAQLGWAMMTKAIEPRPLFTAYSERCRARPGSQRAEAKDAALQKART